MTKFTRRLIVLMLCCWLPLPALATAAFECHLLEAVLIHPEVASKESPEQNKEHQGCGGQAMQQSSVSNPVKDTKPPCNHCQLSCHKVQLLLILESPCNLPPEVQLGADYTIPQPEIVFLSNPQRPPQAV